MQGGFVLREVFGRIQYSKSCVEDVFSGGAVKDKSCREVLYRRRCLQDESCGEDVFSAGASKDKSCSEDLFCGRLLQG